MNKEIYIDIKVKKSNYNEEYLEFKAETKKIKIHRSNIKILIPINLYYNKNLLDAYIKGIIYKIIEKDINKNKKTLIKIKKYKLGYKKIE